jgi:RNA polymerase sigma-70 factor (ECF subfamily)
MILIGDNRCEDVVAEVFVALWFFPEKFDPARGTLLAYLRLKARGRSIDLVRAETARTRREASERPHSLDVDADDVLVGAESALAVRTALVQLPAAEREAIVLAYFSGLSYGTVAVRLGLPEGTVKSRIRSGLGRLRRNGSLLSLGDRDHVDGEGPTR